MTYPDDRKREELRQKGMLNPDPPEKRYAWVAVVVVVVLLAVAGLIYWWMGDTPHALD